MFEAIRSRLQLKLIFAFVLVLLIPTAIIAFYSISTTTGILAEKTRDDQLSCIHREFFGACPIGCVDAVAGCARQRVSYSQ